QLREVFDGIDVMVRRRRDEADAGRCAADFGDPRIHFRAGKFAAFAGFRALRHLDLEFLRVDEVIARHAETTGGDLFDGGVFRIAVRFPDVPGRVFAAFAGIAPAADAVHRDGERFVRFLADRTVTHRAGLETFDDGVHRLDLLDGQRLRRELQ